MIFFCGMCLDIKRKMLEDERLLNELYLVSDSSHVRLKVIEHCVIECSSNSSLLMETREVCEDCNKNRKNTVIENVSV